MSKQELIDMAVCKLDGKLPQTRPEEARLNDGSYPYFFKVNDFREIFIAQGVCDNESICTFEDYQQRARELGWVNGYKWGVEYPTNGKKPDLPDDVIVMVREGVSQTVSNVYWPMTTNFKIVDNRCNPAEVEQIQDDKSAAEVNGYVLLDMLDNLSDDEMVWFQQSDEAKSLLKLLTNLKADEEKQKFVEAAISVFNTARNNMVPTQDSDLKTVFGKLYDAGCRFAENKAAS